jgi:hypothetical protein
MPSWNNTTRHVNDSVALDKVVESETVSEWTSMAMLRFGDVAHGSWPSPLSRFIAQLSLF